MTRITFSVLGFPTGTHVLVTERTMVRMLSDRLSRIEATLLALGAFAASVLLVLGASDDFAGLFEGTLPAFAIFVYGLKLLLMEAALLAPFVVLALLSRALLRETTRHRYRWAGLAISLGASAGVAAMLASGLVRVELEAAMDTLIGGVVPALVLLTTCALLYGGLIWLAQHGQLERIIATPSERARRDRDG